MTEAVILGGGFGGLEAAVRLRETLGGDVSVTVLDRRSGFIVGAAKLWQLVGLEPAEAARGGHASLNAKGIRFVQAEIFSFDPENRTVTTSEGEFSGDHLVVALGAAFAPQHLRMLETPAFNLYDPGALPDMKAALDDLESGRIAIVVMGVPYKCPPAPYEAALLIDHALRERGRRDAVELAVYTVQPAPLPVAGADASRKISSALAERGIELHVEHKGIEVDASARSFSFAEGEPGNFDLLLGVPKHVPPPLIADSAIAGPEGWIRPDPATLETAFDGVYAIGDCISIPNAIGEVPKAGVFAEAQGRVVADRIAASVRGGEYPTFDGFGYCFLEFARGQAAKVEGNFMAEPKPTVSLVGPDEAIFAAKKTFVAERIERWFGA